MPIYEYECGSCGHRLEALQKISDEPLVHCPECNNDQLKKLISAAAFRLKGTGWYETDFKGGNKDDGKTGSNDGEKPAGSTEKKSESKAGSGDDTAKASKAPAGDSTSSSTSTASA